MQFPNDLLRIERRKQQMPNKGMQLLYTLGMVQSTLAKVSQGG